MIQTRNNYKDPYCKSSRDDIKPGTITRTHIVNQAEMIQTRNNYKDPYCKSRRDDINQEQLQGHIL